VQWDGALPPEDPGYVHRSIAQFSL
jgi:hypothetical protein